MKVTINDDIVQICIKDVMSNIEKILLNENGINELMIVWEKIKYNISENLINDIYNLTGLRCKIMSFETDFNNNSRKIIVKIYN